MARLRALWRDAPPRAKRLALASCCGGLALVVAVSLAFGPTVRAVVGAEARRRGLELRVGAVRPAFGGVVLREVAANLSGVPGLQVHADAVAVFLDWRLRPADVRLGTVDVRVSGSLESLRAALAVWRNDHMHTVGVPKRRRVVSAIAKPVALQWLEAPGEAPRALARDMSLSIDAEGVHVAVPVAEVRLDGLSLAVRDATASLDDRDLLTTARVANAVVRRASVADDPPMPPSLEAKHPPSHLPVPDIAKAHAFAMALARHIGAYVAEGASIVIDAMTAEVGLAGGGGAAAHASFSVGPGRLDAKRSTWGLEAQFASAPSPSGAPLSVRALLPLEARDAEFSLAGGPVSLAALGIGEGQGPFIDVSDTKVSARATVVLAADASALTFDGEAGVQNLSLDSAALAPEPVRGLGVTLRARGVLGADGAVRLDDAGADLGDLHLSAAGALEQDSSGVAGHLHAAVARTACQALVDALPAALVPALRGARLSGTFEAHAGLEFDTRALDKLKLDLQLGEPCHVTLPSQALSAESLGRPFLHRVVLADGRKGEEETGPGTPNWAPLESISPFMEIAVLTTEDGAFWRHRGFNTAAIRGALAANLKSGRFVRGGSTITMQLAKNLFLSREKTLARKLEELVLTEYLEQELPKARLLELYLNVIEFGPSVYGITAAADHYFGRTPRELNLAESFFLSTLLPSPVRLGKVRARAELPERWLDLLHTLMEIAHRLGRITDAELAEGKTEKVSFWNGTERPTPRPPAMAELPSEGRADDAVQDPIDPGDSLDAPPTSDPSRDGP